MIAPQRLSPECQVGRTRRDALGRELSSLRLSVTDRCNLRCAYCMPQAPPAWLPNPRLLTFEELARLVDAFLLLGVGRLRLTGGEPLVRRGLPTLVSQLSGKPGLRDLALTTNGMLLGEQAFALRQAGLRRVNVSLDTLQRARFRALTHRDGLERVLSGIEAARTAGLVPLKLDTVVIRGRNDDELVALLEYARGVGAELRFIEYMDVGGATGWSRGAVVPRTELLGRIERALGPVVALSGRGSAPAERFALADGTTFGIIASVTQPFCGDCDRARLTADGMLFTCLHSREGLDLRTPLRSGASTQDLAERIQRRWILRRDRGAEQREAHPEADAHSRMHTRGG